MGKERCRVGGVSEECYEASSPPTQTSEFPLNVGFEKKLNNYTMPRETSPGLKILWVWTIGTAAVLVTSVVRTRLRDMEKVMNTDEQPTRSDSFLLDSSPESDEVVREDKSQFFGCKKTIVAVAITFCKIGLGLIKINSSSIDLVELEILHYKAYKPIFLVDRHRFAEDMRIHASQIYTIR
ncbi:hypothetical protein L1049_020710 [Liquidambar formosana]|uniref:Uncharacterized protein n=1 Tax=Liquidambar formosana TaxID=63359 RepID=A0AAP0S8B5_LIQFO